MRFCPFIFRNAEQQRILWKIPDISQKSENGGKNYTQSIPTVNGLIAGIEQFVISVHMHQQINSCWKSASQSIIS